jgi:hypothetical protein
MAQIWRITDDSTVILPSGARKVKIRRGLFGAEIQRREFEE